MSCSINFEENNKVIKRVTYWGLLINTVLSFAKLFLGIAGRSSVVVADAIHSFSDSITDIAIIVGLKYWNAPPDRTHPYGHSRIEGVVTIFIGLCLVVVGVGIAYEGTHHLVYSSKLEKATAIALWGPVLSVIVKEILYQWNYRVGKKINSSSLVANAWHHRSDVISSLVALVAVAITVIFPKLYFMDSVGSIVVALFILKISYDLIYPVLKELVDSSAPKEFEDAVLAYVMSIDGVKSAHALRSRISGPQIMLDFHVLVDGDITVTEGHNISEHVREQVQKSYPSISDIVIHIEPF